MIHYILNNDEDFLSDSGKNLAMFLQFKQLNYLQL